MRQGWILLLSVLVAAPAVAASQVEVVRSAEVDYSEFETFAVRGKKGLHPDHPLAGGSPLWKKLAAVAERTMEDRGYTRDTSGSPDLWIVFDGIAKDALTVEGVHIDVGPVTWVGTPLDYTSRTVREGTLIIDVLEATGGTRVWTGWASDAAQSVPKLRKKAEKATRRILREFPAR